MNELIKQVEEWSKSKGLDKAESSKQFLKVAEEVGEVASALARGQRDELRDGIGDVIVTLIILAQQNDMDIHECLNTAYDEIKGRTGKMVDGVFVKSEDLEECPLEPTVGELDTNTISADTITSDSINNLFENDPQMYLRSWD